MSDADPLAVACCLARHDRHIGIWSLDNLEGTHHAFLCIRCGIHRDTPEFERAGVFIWVRIRKYTEWRNGQCLTSSCAFETLEEVSHVVPVEYHHLLNLD